MLPSQRITRDKRNDPECKANERDKECRVFDRLALHELAERDEQDSAGVLEPGKEELVLHYAGHLPGQKDGGIADGQPDDRAAAEPASAEQQSEDCAQGGKCLSEV